MNDPNYNSKTPPEMTMTTASSCQEEADTKNKNETAGYLLSLSAAASSNYSIVNSSSSGPDDYDDDGDDEDHSNCHDHGELKKCTTKDDMDTPEQQEGQKEEHLLIDDGGGGNKLPATTSNNNVTKNNAITTITTSTVATPGESSASSAAAAKSAGDGNVDDTDCTNFFPRVVHATPPSDNTVDHTYRDYSVVEEETLAIFDHIDENGEYKHPDDEPPLSLVQANAIKTQLKQMEAIFGGLGPTRRNSGGVTQPFPEKLMEVLDRGDMDYIVTWMPHGRSFLVLQPQAFVREVLPRFFKQSKFMSFTRQLNLWGFKRLTKGPDSGSYYHELFLRGRPRLCLRMKRQKIKGTGIKLTPSPDTEPNFYDISNKSPLLPPSISAKHFKPLPPLPPSTKLPADSAHHNSTIRTNFNFHLEPSPPLVASTINPRVIPTTNAMCTLQQEPNMSTMLQFPTIPSTAFDTFTSATATRANALPLPPGYGNQQTVLFQLRTPTEAAGNFIESSNRISPAQYGATGNVASSSMLRPINPSSLAIANTNQLTYPPYLPVNGNSHLINLAPYDRFPHSNHQHLSYNRHINANSQAIMDRNIAFDDRQQAIHAAQQLLLQIDPTNPETLVSTNQSESATIESLKRRLLAAAQSLDQRIVSQPYQHAQALGASYCTPSAAISIPHQHLQSPINTLDRDSYQTNISSLLSALEQTQRVAAVQQENHLLKQYVNELSSAALQRPSPVTGIPFPHNFHRSSIPTATSSMLMTNDQVEQQLSTMHHVLQYPQHPNFPTPFDSA